MGSFLKFRRFAGILILGGFALVIGATSANAMPFIIDEFWVTKDGTQIFRDSFNGTTPPDGPDSFPTYTGSGAGMTNVGSKLAIDPTQGTTPIITGGFGNFFTGAIRRRSTTSSNSNFLGLANAFSINALYDLSSLPVFLGDSFGIRATDRFGAANPGDDVIALSVRLNTSGTLGVGLRELDFIGIASDRVDFVPLDLTTFSTATQIQLTISKDTDTNAVDASFTLFDSSHILLDMQSLSTFSTAKSDVLRIYNGEDFTRAEFQALASRPVPEPSTLLLLASGLAGLGFFRMRKKAA